MSSSVEDPNDAALKADEAALRVRTAIASANRRIAKEIGTQRRAIVDVVDGPAGATRKVVLTERELRVINYALGRAVESV